jgi:hypothetical protein
MLMAFVATALMFEARGGQDTIHFGQRLLDAAFDNGHSVSFQ